MTNKELKSLIKLLRSQGVTEYSYQGLILRLDIKTQPSGTNASIDISKTQGEPAYTEEDTLFWSTPQIQEDNSEL